MLRTRYSQFVCFLAICLALTSCTTPYDPPEFRGEMPFSGARDIAQDGGVVQLIMTHGMCTERHGDSDTPNADFNWVGRRSQAIANAVGDENYRWQNPFSVTKSYYGISTEPMVKRYDLSLTGRDGTVYELRMLRWGMAMAPAHASLDDLETSNQAVPIRRATLNHQLKTELMDGCLVEAVAYSGGRGNKIRAAYREAICDLMGGRISGDNLGLADEKDVSCQVLNTKKSLPTIIVPESLGAKVMMDAVNSLSTTGRLGSVKAIHLATNQIPLLSQAEDPMDSAGLSSEESGPAEFKSMLTKFSTDPEKGTQVPLQVVVYNDANDLVGYPLSKDWVLENASLTNVLLSNGKTFFAYVENPLDAHYGTARPQVFNMIVEGSDADLRE